MVKSVIVFALAWALVDEIRGYPPGHYKWVSVIVVSLGLLATFIDKWWESPNV